MFLLPLLRTLLRLFRFSFHTLLIAAGEAENIKTPSTAEHLVHLLKDSGKEHHTRFVQMGMTG